MLRASPGILRSALFSALGLVPVACGGKSFGDDGDGSGGSAATGGTSTGGSATTGGTGASTGGSRATGGSASTGGTGVGGTATTGGTGVGGTVSSGGTGTGGGSEFPCTEPEPLPGGYERCGDGTVHRPRVDECPSSLPRSSPVPNPIDGDQCQYDSECTEYDHGMCTRGDTFGGPESGLAYCEYGCVTDDDCADGQICVCGDPIGECVASSCTSDADCGAGFRCQSYDYSLGCGLTQFACQTPEDTCSTNADCGTNEPYCTLKEGRFQCQDGGCVIGRPFLVQGAERLARTRRRDDWRDEELALQAPWLQADLRALVVDHWTRVARMEHASIAAFARFAMLLLQHGAPPELLSETAQAMTDETAHARLAFAVASLYGGRPIGPDSLDVQGSLTTMSLEEVTRLTFREGCVGETVAALEALEASEHVKDGRLAGLLRRVAADETRHAELAFAFVRWALERGGEAVRRAVVSELAALDVPSEDSVPELSLLAREALSHGVVPGALRLAVRGRALRELVLPCVRALLGQSAGETAASARASA